MPSDTPTPATATGAAIAFDETNFGINREPGFGLLNDVGAPMHVTVHARDIRGNDITDEAKALALRIVTAVNTYPAFAAMRKVADAIMERCREASSALPGTRDILDDPNGFVTISTAMLRNLRDALADNATGAAGEGRA